MTRLPQLEHELAAAALRIHGPRRTARRVAPLVAAALAAAAAIALLVPGGDDGESTRPAAKPPRSEAPSPQPTPIDGTRSPRQQFEVGDTRYSALGFRSRGPMICVALRQPDLDLRLSVGCLSARSLPNALARRPAHVFAGGGLRQGGFERTGFARADVTSLRSRGATVFLSEPWRPWNRAPIRFFIVFTPDAEPRRGLQLERPLHGQLADGRAFVVR